MKILITGSTQGIGKQLYEDLKQNNEVYTINRKEVDGNNFVCNLVIVGTISVASVK